MKFTSTEATPAPHVPPGVLRLTGAAKEDIPMYRIQTMNKISPVGLNRFPSELYEVGDAVQDPQGILVRSAKLLDLEFNPGLLAIARAGVGVNNIPLDRCAAVQRNVVDPYARTGNGQQPGVEFQVQQLGGAD